jgi:hypothetical protein
MILISHRGNINGKILETENHPDYIDKAISLGYDVEIDIWMVNGVFFLGHDEPQYKIEINWVDDRNNKLWVHCKNTEVMEFFNKFNYDINYFWHQNDNIVLTSKKFLWVHPGKQPINNSIAVLPEQYNDDIKKCIGICSDFIIKYNL